MANRSSSSSTLAVKWRQTANRLRKPTLEQILANTENPAGRDGRAELRRLPCPAQRPPAAGLLDRRPPAGQQTYAETRDTTQAGKAFLALVDRGTTGILASMAGTPYA